ncbi:hypothetical protein [Streptomyces dysideae]|uniref:Uncharacterized protein n=1 Tax=Streptomyces dysideae TaxID=909626 RepID=A0A101V3E2_9ACTN|nr:hypothetical protein [Streptomyces dysideae]KUO21790.1 hypothetical protein AQJ91_06515 [Streptomyces dysideae]
MTAPELSEPDYLREIERLAHRVTVEAADEGWLSFEPSAEPDDATPLRCSVNALARALHRYHFDGDGCVEQGRSPVRLVGATVLKPGRMPAGTDDTYDEVCARLGVPPRPEGWALWNTWGDGDLKVTMVVSAVGTTEGLLENWSRGRAVDPATPLPSQIALVRRGWTGPMTFSPRGVRRLGLDGQPLS